MERRESELSFDTNIDGVSGFIVAETATLKSVRIFVIALVEAVSVKENKKKGKTEMITEKDSMVPKHVSSPAGI